MVKKKQQPIYVSPMLKSVDLRARTVLCQSGGIDPMERDDDVLDDEDFDFN